MIKKAKSGLQEFIKIIAVVAFIFSFFSCENDIPMVMAVTNSKAFPDVEGFGMEILYSDSAKLKARVLAPEIDMFETVSRPYTEFPKGIHVYLYSDSGKVTGEIMSKYAIYNKTTEIWEARNNVVGYSPKGDKLNTEQLFWNMRQKKFYSTKFSVITSPDGNQQNSEGGFVSNEDFSHYKFYSTTGTKIFKDEEL